LLPWSVVAGGPSCPARTAGRASGTEAAVRASRVRGPGGVHSSVTDTYGVRMVQPGPARTSAVDEQLCFALYRASRAMTSVYRPLLERLGLTYPQYLVLLVLWDRGATTVTGIGNAVALDTGTLSPLLKRLEVSGFITRTRQADDERSVLITLTGAGRDLEAPVADVQRQATQATGLTVGELAEMRSSLRRLTARLRSAASARSA
jgi:MarR family transcriptional regulator, organic hydroperoxide resistance regulator